MNDLTIIGAGFFGVAAATAAERLGVTVQVVDDSRADSGSRNAAGLLRPPTDRVKARIPADWHAKPGYEWLDKLRLTSEVREDRWTYTHPEIRSSSLRVVHPSGVLDLAKPEQAQVAWVTAVNDGWLVESFDGLAWWSRKVLIAAGVWTDSILSRSNLPAVGVGSLRGRALIVRVPDKEPDGVVYSWTTRPYTTFAMRPWDTAEGTWRFGDTVEPKADGGKPYAELLRALAAHVPGAEFVGELNGLRPVTDQLVCKEVAPGLVASTGGHRSGLSFAGIAAHRAMQLFGWAV